MKDSQEFRGWAWLAQGHSVAELGFELRSVSLPSEAFAMQVHSLPCQKIDSFFRTILIAWNSDFMLQYKYKSLHFMDIGSYNSAF